MADEENGGAVSTLPQRNLTLLRVVAMLMAGTSAGPYGFEECIGSGGAALTLLGLLVVPFIWSAPIALVTGELSTAIAGKLTLNQSPWVRKQKQPLTLRLTFT